MKNGPHYENATSKIYMTFGFVALVLHLAAAIIVGGFLGTLLAVLGVATLMVMQDAISKIKTCARELDRVKSD